MQNQMKTSHERPESYSEYNEDEEKEEERDQERITLIMNLMMTKKKAQETSTMISKMTL